MWTYGIAEWTMSSPGTVAVRGWHGEFFHGGCRAEVFARVESREEGVAVEATDGEVEQDVDERCG